MPGIDEIADELYGLLPEEFIAARARHEKEAKAAGDRELAARIHGLVKPSGTAWLANQLARSHRDEVVGLLELGAALRDATHELDGDQLRALSRQQRELMHALVQQARGLAGAAGRSVSEDAARGLEDTLRAALADEQAGSLLLAGRLAEALHNSGFGAGFGFGSGLVDTTDVADVIPISRKAEQDVIDAQRNLADATAALDEARVQAADADQAAASAQERLEELRQQLETATSAATAADNRRRDLTSALQRAERAVRDAEASARALRRGE